MKYIVQVCNEPSKVFSTPEEAMSYATKRVFLSPTYFQGAVDVLRKGEVYTFSYGFSGVDIIPSNHIW